MDAIADLPANRPISYTLASSIWRQTVNIPLRRSILHGMYRIGYISINRYDPKWMSQVHSTQPIEPDTLIHSNCHTDNTCSVSRERGYT